jgi:hypothetical protein
MVRKQTMLILESRGCARDHPEFKDVFGYTYKGVYLALVSSLSRLNADRQRYKLEDRLDKNVVQDLVVRHLDMYLPSAPEGTDIEDEAEDEDEDDAPFGEAAGNPSPDADMSLRSFRSATDIDMRTPSPRR